MIKEICNKLKEKRRELGYSIEYVVEKTKLYPSMIKDIEEGNLAKVSPTYIKGFIKIYASFLKIDIGTSLNEISASKPLPAKSKLKSKLIDGTGVLKNIGHAIRRISPETRKKIILILAGIILLWGFFALSGFLIRKISKIFTAPSKNVQAAKERIVSPSLNDEEVVAILTAKKNCFLKVIVDGKLLFKGVLKKGARETWRGDKEIELKIRDGSAILLEVNGRVIPTLTSLRKPIKSLKITPKGIVVDK